ncbi:MAG: hypothetical protein D6685_00690 [Bacteroidetes bacterium]|nr:MAG: hypothetical protein D6685_00690 [Bacteroidota bacterium]
MPGDFPQGRHCVIDFGSIGVASPQLKPDDDGLRGLAELLKLIGRTYTLAGIVRPLTSAAQTRAAQ